MATVKQFVDAVTEVFSNHGIYVGTGNGEQTEKLTLEKIRKMEETYGRSNPGADARRVLEFVGKCYEQGIDMSKSVAVDCSGLAVYALRKIGTLKDQDYRARDFQKMATRVSLSSMQPGDLVFDQMSNATHMGVFIGYGYVIESRGRSYGVVKRKTSEGPWVTAGRLDWFSDDIPVLTRNLKYIKDKPMKGKDVEQLQQQLTKRGFKPGSIDGIFGINTLDAVVDFQTMNNLEIDGIVGPATWAALFTE